MNNESPAALLPCPVCRAQIAITRDADYLSRIYLSGHKDGCAISMLANCVLSEKEDQFVKSWNQRAPVASDSRGSVPDGWKKIVADAAASLDKRGDRETCVELMRVHEQMLAVATTPPAVASGEPQLLDRIVWSQQVGARKFDGHIHAITHRAEGPTAYLIKLYDGSYVHNAMRGDFELARGAAAKGEGQEKPQ